MKGNAFLFFLVTILIVVLTAGLCACSNTDDSGQGDSGTTPTPAPTTYTVSFDSLGGSLAASQQIEKGGLVQKPQDPTKDGYTFEGWFDLNGSENGEWGDEWKFDSYPVNASFTLYAKWNEIPKTYTVTFYNGSEVYDKQENLSVGEITIEPTAPTAADKTFIGWFLSTDGGVTLGSAYDFSLPVSANIDLYAKWETKLFINFDYNGATHANETQRIEVGQGAQYQLPRPMKSESTFLGWFDANDEKVEMSGTFSGTESISLTAKWSDGTAGIVYETNDSFAKVVGADTSLTEVIIPESYDGFYVKEISASAFKNVTNLQKITLCEGITDIGEAAFSSLVNLAEVNLPTTLKTIGLDAFYATSGLKNIAFNEGLETISQRAFRLSGLTSVTVPSTVTKIFDGAFNECSNLRTVTFTRDKNAAGGITVPNGASRAILRQNKAGLVVFVPTNSLDEYTAAWNTQFQWQMTEKVAIFSDEYANADEIVREGVLYAYFGTESEYVTNGVTEIYCGAFEDNTNIQSVVLSDGFVKIGASAFSGCTNLQSVTSLSENIPTIKQYGKDNQTFVNVFDDANSVAMSVSASCYEQFEQSQGFNASTIEKITYTVTLKDGDNQTTLSVGRYESIDFPEADRVLGKKIAGYTVNGETFDAATKITSDIEVERMWEDCNVYTVAFVTFCDETIAEQQLNEGEKVARPQNPNTGDARVFEGWYLSDDNGVTLTTEYDFSTAVTKNITLYAKYSEVDTRCVITLDYNGATHAIGVDEISKAVGETFELPRPYRNDATFLGWFDSSDVKYEMTGTVTSVDDYTLTAKWLLASEGLAYVISNQKTNYSVKAGTCTDLDVIIPEWHEGYVVDIIGVSAFEGKNITSVVLPDTIKTINKRAFFGTSLTEITIPATVTNLYEGAFNRCADLKLVTILRSAKVDGSITKVANDAVFRLVSPGITVIVPADSVDEYKADTVWKSQQNRWGSGSTWSFEDAERLFSADDITEGGFIVRGTTLYGYVGSEENIVIPANITKIADGAFHGSNATSVTLHDNITAIGAMAFANMQNVTEIVLPANLASIGAKAFDGCDNLVSVTFTSITVPTITTVQLWAGVSDNVTTASDIFVDNGDTLTVYVPADMLDAYKATFANANISAKE